LVGRLAYVDRSRAFVASASRAATSCVRSSGNVNPRNGRMRVGARWISVTKPPPGTGEPRTVSQVAEPLRTVLAAVGVFAGTNIDDLIVLTVLFLSGPMFRTIGVSSSLVTVTVFTVLVAVWCAVGSWLGSHPALVAAVRRFGHWLVPVVFVAVGSAIIAQSGVVYRLL